MLHFACVDQAGRCQFMRALYDIALGMYKAVIFANLRMLSLTGVNCYVSIRLWSAMIIVVS